LFSAVNTGFYTALRLWPETWVTVTTYAVGDVIKKTGTYAAYTYKCTTAGISGSSEPSWGTPVIGGTKTDGTVTWTTYDSKTYQVKAPQGSTVPYVTFGLETDMPMGTFESQMAMESLTFWVNAFSDKSTADVAEIADEIMTALDDVTLTVIGYTSMKCIREFIGSIIWDLETGIYQCPLRYRVLLDKT